MTIDRNRQYRKAGIAVAGALLGVTLVAVPIIGQGYLAADLDASAREALRRGEPADADVVFSGREAVVSGPDVAAAQLRSAAAAVRSVPGVRWVRIRSSAVGEPGSAGPTGDHQTVAGPAVSPTHAPDSSTTGTVQRSAIDPSVRIVARRDGVLLEGTVPSDADADALVAQSERLFGAPVISRLVIDPACAGSAWLDRFVTGLAAFPTISGIDLTASGAGLALDGTVADDAARHSLRQTVGGLGLKVSNTVTIAPTSPVSAVDAARINATVVYFGWGCYELDAAGRQALDAILPALRAGKVAIDINGYVSLPHAGDAVADSQRRADAVRAHLIRGGVRADRIAAVGHGAANPAGSNDTAAGRAANQRATLTVKGSN